MEHTCPFHGTCQSLIRECEQLRENDRVVMLETGDLKERIVAVEQSSKSAHHRLDSMEEQTKAVIRLAMSVENMSEKVEKVLKLYDEHDTRLLDLEKKPGESALHTRQWIMVTVGSAAVGMLFALLTAALTGYLKIGG